MERESFEDFARRVGIAIEELRKEICDSDEEPGEEIDDPYYVEPHHTSDFACSRWCFRHRDLVPWHTAGFK